ncbi:unnamed protein product [Heligmosomoides polygyrus]|uniref:Uncharacterized protein n=1 Tax=Heligmosomoides polygyrus TaxID=6339 RepID=A0A183GD37_HELPZ|nr:unnamed protein product [Heligmosomoides polygyrus]
MTQSIRAECPSPSRSDPTLCGRNRLEGLAHASQRLLGHPQAERSPLEVSCFVRLSESVATWLLLTPIADLCPGPVARETVRATEDKVFDFMRTKDRHINDPISTNTTRLLTPLRKLERISITCNGATQRRSRGTHQDNPGEDTHAQGDDAQMDDDGIEGCILKFVTLVHLFINIFVS